MSIRKVDPLSLEPCNEENFGLAAWCAARTARAAARSTDSAPEFRAWSMLRCLTGAPVARLTGKGMDFQADNGDLVREKLAAVVASVNEEDEIREVGPRPHCTRTQTNHVEEYAFF